MNARKYRLLAAGCIACLSITINTSATYASTTDTAVAGGARTCSGSTHFVGIQFRGNGTLTTYTDNLKRYQVYYANVTTGQFESTFHTIGSWSVATTDSINASSTYSYCYYSL